MDYFMNTDDNNALILEYGINILRVEPVDESKISSDFSNAVFSISLKNADNQNIIAHGINPLAFARMDKSYQIYTAYMLADSIRESAKRLGADMDTIEDILPIAVNDIANDALQQGRKKKTAMLVGYIKETAYLPA
jgi:hypothetical protein